MFQFQAFCLYKANPGKRSPEEYEDLLSIEQNQSVCVFTLREVISRPYLISNYIAGVEHLSGVKYSVFFAGKITDRRAVACYTRRK